MVQVIRGAVSPEGGTFRFEGADYGPEISFFLVAVGPGEGSSLHLHPYCETWIVRSGLAAFEIGGETTRAGAGDIVVAPAEIPHKFTNVGTGRLELVCIHPAGRIAQTDLA